MSRAVNEILELQLKTIWEGRTPIAYDDVSYMPAKGKAFIKCMMENVFSTLTSPGCQREHYLYTVQVYTPAWSGSNTNFDLADVVVKGFFNYASGTLICKEVRTLRVGNQEEWYRSDVQIAVQYDNHL